MHFFTCERAKINDKINQYVSKYYIYQTKILIKTYDIDSNIVWI